ncbi:MFS transporter [Peribacillus glennii]|uniref:MFS transporter n=1 Tax=Peribacillus glennii TaxID=2303991 RepID=A0A372LBS5_9BACI|nr:MFS transporter [Peribacillus glennii]RFU62932.1 MFS transporter [Peribacillus glennii]
MNQKILFWVLVSIVGISGFSQGMLLPLIAIIFENDGVSSSLNGFHATGLYLGVLVASPLMEAPLRKFGYKPLILVGGLAVVVSLALFPVWKSFWFWFILRLAIGIGDHMLHFATQTWITAISPDHKRGRNISIYGLFFSIGFAVGPLMTKLVETSEALPFMLTSAISLITWFSVFLLKNERPDHDHDIETSSFFGTLKRFSKVSKYAWIAFLPPFGYGFLEASLNGNFPVHALRSGIELTMVSLIITSFSAGSLLSQIPLGMMSDTFGRRKILLFILFSGFLIFLCAGFLYGSASGLLVCFLLSGVMVGSTFSLGISYMADLVPRNLLPTGNLLCGIFFSLGSISGPFIGGFVIEYLTGGSFFFVISFMLLLIFFALALFKDQAVNLEETEAFASHKNG